MTEITPEVPLSYEKLFGPRPTSRTGRPYGLYGPRYVKLWNGNAAKGLHIADHSDEAYPKPSLSINLRYGACRSNTFDRMWNEMSSIGFDKYLGPVTLEINLARTSKKQQRAYEEERRVRHQQIGEIVAHVRRENPGVEFDIRRDETRMYDDRFGACPMQVYGHIDGEKFYFRFRGNNAYLTTEDGCGTELRTAHWYDVYPNDPYAGYLEDAHFAGVLAKLVGELAPIDAETNRTHTMNLALSVAEGLMSHLIYEHGVDSDMVRNALENEERILEPADFKRLVEAIERYKENQELDAL